MKNSMSCGIRNGEVVSARGATACFVKGIYVFIVDVVIKFRVLRQCVVFSSRSNITVGGVFQLPNCLGL